LKLLKENSLVHISTFLTMNNYQKGGEVIFKQK